MKHSNVALFVPHNGCPHRCSFCNQKEITGQAYQPTPDDVVSAVNTARKSLGDKTQNTEIAFFGGSFTAIDRGYMTELLSAAAPYVKNGEFEGIRLSTRPDAIDNDVLDILKEYGVTSIELGAQSMCDDVLIANHRGHSAKDVQDASHLIKDYGFSLGLQMMTGMYKSSDEKDKFTAKNIADLQPDTVRIYPTVILKNTRLGELFQKGEYVPYSFEECAELCAELLELFEKNNIRVIKLGLHASETVEADMLGGFYHQAFREICEGIIFRKKIDAEISQSGKFTVFTAQNEVSKAAGHKSCNKKYFAEKGIYIKFKPDKNISGRNILIQKDE